MRIKYWLIGLVGVFALASFNASLSRSVYAQEANAFIAEVRAKAEAGDAEASLLGLMYDLGRGVLKCAPKLKQGMPRLNSIWGGCMTWAKVCPRMMPKPCHGIARRRSRDMPRLKALICMPTIEGVPEDDAQAVSWFRKAAQQGGAGAQYALGGMYDGRGVPEDDAQAVSWYRKAAQQGHAFGSIRSGVMYDLGEGVPEDDAQAVSWYRKAAQQGDASAQYVLGVMYDFGRGVPEDDAQAVSWYRKAAQQGHAEAQFNLGVMYDNGEGVPEDDAQAVSWYRKAAQQGDVFGSSRSGGDV